MSKKSEMAVEHHNNGYSCAQSVAAVFCEDYGLSEEMGLKVTGGLGGGCRSGEICGVASGGAVVVGLKHGATDAGDKDAKAFCNGKITEYMKKFRENNGGCLTCKDILGFDVSFPENAARVASGEMKPKCNEIIRSAVETLIELGY